MKTETCPTCGGSGVVEDRLVEFETKIPKGCVCSDHGWCQLNIPEICDKYDRNVGASNYGFPTACKTCEHDEACHKSENSHD